MDLTQAELQGHAEFDHEGFTLRQTPPGLPPTDAPPGRYELPRRSEDAHLYRTGELHVRDLTGLIRLAPVLDGVPGIPPLGAVGRALSVVDAVGGLLGRFRR